MCESLAAGARDTVQADEGIEIGSSSWEWLGLTAGFLLAGARRTPVGEEAQGAGLGLAIARELAERMQGQLTVRSVPGATTFSLELPG